MAGAKGSALEWALALLRAPGERHALRQRPLPEGVAELLGVASEPDDAALSDIAMRWGECPERLREAARFYAREILFHPQADAYRVLGLTPTATPEAIKSHHRLLQRWLHPDRQHAGDDAVFAGRVNTAWNQLRSDERRQAYDAARAGERVPEVIDTGERALPLGDWRAGLADAAPPPLPAWRRRAPVYALLLACAVLAWLGLRDAAAPPPGVEWDLAESGEGADTPALQVPADARKAVATATSKPPARRPTARSGATNVSAPPPRAIARAIPEPVVAPAAGPVAPPVASQVPPPARSVGRDALVMEPAPAPAATIAAAAPPRAQATPIATLDVDAGTPEIVAAVAPRVVAPAAVAVRPPPAPQAAAASPPLDEEAQQAFVRAQQARAVGDQLMRYMGTTSGIAPPIWNSPAIQSSADLMRQDLHAGGRVRLGRPQWRIGAGGASVSVPAGTAGNGRVTADLVFREGRWLVTGLSVEDGS